MSHKFTDGVGTTLKRHAMKKVIKRKCAINNAGEFYNAVKDSNIQAGYNDEYMRIKVFCLAPQNSFQEWYTNTCYNSFSFYRFH